MPGILFHVAKAFWKLFSFTFLFYGSPLNEANLPLKALVWTTCQCKHLLLPCVLLGFLPVFYKEIYHIFLQTVEMSIHQPRSDVHSGVPGKDKKRNVTEFCTAIYKSLTLQLNQWTVKSVRRQICSFPSAPGLTEENSAGCHYWTVYKLTPAGPGLICCERKHLLQGVITPATSPYVSGNCTLLGSMPK